MHPFLQEILMDKAEISLSRDNIKANQPYPATYWTQHLRPHRIVMVHISETLRSFLVTSGVFIFQYGGLELVLSHCLNIGWLSTSPNEFEGKKNFVHLERLKVLIFHSLPIFNLFKTHEPFPNVNMGFICFVTVTIIFIVYRLKIKIANT